VIRVTHTHEIATHDVSGNVTPPTDQIPLINTHGPEGRPTVVERSSLHYP
jgi:hypothetical protein